jgi:signal transduction histidine kinase
MSQTFTPEHNSRLSQMPVEYELCMSLGWLCKLRWIAGTGVIIATLLASTVLGLGLPVIPISTIGALILVYNAVFQRWLGQIQCHLSGVSSQSQALARTQIAVDWVAMTALIHLSGGVESPMVLYFFFHTTLSAILLSTEDTYIFSALAAALITGTALLEYVGVLPHYHVEGLLPVDLYNNGMYVGGVLFFFVSAVFVSAYLATRTTRRLRERQGEMMRLGQELRLEHRRLETLYEGARAVSSTLELQEVLDRLTKSTTEVMAVKGCTIRLLHETDTQLCLASMYGLSEDYLQKGCLLVEQNPLVRQVLSGDVVYIPDITKDDRLQYPAEAAAEGIRATITAPLHGKRGPLGIIRIYCENVDCFTEEDAQFLTAVASHGSIAIDNAMAFEAVQHLEEAKRKFVLLVTHELRSPVGVVRSLLRTLSGGYAGELSDLQADMLNRALRRTEFLQTLIDDLLNLAAGKTGLRMAQEAATVDLVDVLNTIHDRYRVPSEEKGIDLELQVDGEGPLLVLANSDEIDRAITNLVSNAVKYTPTGGRVRITLTDQGRTVLLTISDTGIGIPEEALPHLFEEFYRAPNAKAQVKQGTGLGLVITRDIVNRHGGTIHVTSTIGEGTTFSILLPTAQERHSTPQA